MPGSVTSVFSEPEDFEAALREEGCLGLLITGRGQFRAQLTQVALHRLRLSAAEEHLSRIALCRGARRHDPGSFPIGRPAPIWGGIGMRAGEIMTLGPGQRMHARTDGPCRWGSIWLPAEDLVRYGRALTGARSPSRPPHMVAISDRRLAGSCANSMRPPSAWPKFGRQALVDAEAAHGLEQQLIDALVECLSTGSATEAAPATRQHQDHRGPLRGSASDSAGPEFAHGGNLRGARRLGRTLRSLCAEHLGMSPTELPSPAPDVIWCIAPWGAETPVRQASRRSRGAMASAPWPFRSQLSRPVRRVAIRHLAAEFACGNAHLVLRRPRRPV